MSTLTVRIVGDRLPGLRFGEAQAVHVGVQRRAEVVDLVPGDAERAVFDLAVDLVAAPDGGRDFRGPFVHGRRGGRFLYLSWGDVDAAGTFSMFRRAKLHLADIDPHTLDAALAEGAALQATLDLTDECGGPRCATVRPPAVTWSADLTRSGSPAAPRPPVAGREAPSGG